MYIIIFILMFLSNHSNINLLLLHFHQSFHFIISVLVKLLIFIMPFRFIVMGILFFFFFFLDIIKNMNVFSLSKDKILFQSSWIDIINAISKLHITFKIQYAYRAFFFLYIYIHFDFIYGIQWRASLYFFITNSMRYMNTYIQLLLLMPVSLVCASIISHTTVVEWFVVPGVQVFKWMGEWGRYRAREKDVGKKKNREKENEERIEESLYVVCHSKQ